MALQLFRRVVIPVPSSKPPSLLYFSSSQTSDQNSATQSLISNAVSILTYHRSKSRWNQLRSLFPKGFHPNEFSKITLEIKNNPHLALRFYLWTRSKSFCDHNLGSYSTIIHVLARGRLKSNAKDAIRCALRTCELEQSDGEENCVSMPLKVFESLVKTYRDCGSAPFVFDLLINACLESKKMDASIEIVRMLSSRGISPKVSTLNSLIYQFCKSKGVEMGYSIYREVFCLDGGIEKTVKRVVRVSPNLHTFNALMACFYQKGLMEKVKEIWHELAAANCDPNSYSYALLIAAFCEEGRMEQVQELWGKMKSMGVDPDVAMYNAVIGGFCRVGQTCRAEEFFREMQLCGVESSLATYEHLIRGYCIAENVNSAIIVYKDMFRKNFRPEDSIVDVMVESMCDKGMINEALEFFNGAMGSIGLLPKRKSYEALIKGLCKEVRMEEAFKLQSEMVGKGFEPDSEIYGAFVDGFLRQGNLELAEALKKEMVEVEARIKKFS